MSAATLRWRRVESALGSLLVACSERGLCWIGLPGGELEARLERWRARHAPGAALREAPDELEEHARALRGYAEGRVREFHHVLDLRGSAFERAVWAAELAIPYGETRTYAEIARAIGKPRAARAVGGATGRNPVPIVVPCHRVLATGGLGGFGGGLALKRELLALEGVPLAGDSRAQRNPRASSSVSVAWTPTPRRPRAPAAGSPSSTAASR